jgi:hypothetical protein
MAKYILCNITFCAALLLHGNLNLSFAEMQITKSSKEIFFYDVGEDDDLSSALKKNLDKNFKCVKGKSTSMDLDGINLANNRSIAILKKFTKIDNDLRNWESDTDIESMPIDVLHCESKKASAFNYWDYFFSSNGGKLLSMIIDVIADDVAKQHLFLKHGDCIKSDYCVNNDSHLFWVSDKHKFFVLVFFEENIRNHYAEIEKRELERKDFEQKDVEEAF